MQKDNFFFRYNKALIFFFDILLVSASFLILAWIKPATIRLVLPTYWIPFIFFLSIWLSVSFIMGKFHLQNFTKKTHLLFTIALIDIIILAIVTILLFAFKLSAFSRLIVFGTIALSLLFEVISFRFIYKKLKIKDTYKEKIIEEEIKKNDKENSIKKTNNIPSYGSDQAKSKLYRDNLITREAGENIYDYFSEHLNVDDSNVGLISTATPFNIENLQINNIRAIINLKKVNDMRYINKFFESVNKKLPDAGLFIGCVETSKQRYKRMASKFSPFIGQLIIITDFVLNRIIPRLSWSQNIYFNLTHGHGRTISKAETLGRLVSCGFEIIEYKEVNKITYFVVMKTDEPKYNENPSYGPLYKMPRIGKNGDIINVYKFRTMHPFSEYLQDYVLQLNGYTVIGKPADDFRLTKWGKFMRKLWLDELPQLLNVLKGEMAIVGTRPLSKRAYQEYPEDIKEMRSKYKPGCVPPYVALLKQGMTQSIEAERQYLKDRKENPYTTNIKYFFTAVFNIITNKIRSS